MINIVTYNILCSALCGKNTFPESDDNHLNPDKRLEKLQNRFEKCIENDTIICLQEVSRTWYPILMDFFSQRNYNFIYTPYGIQVNDYMGVAIAYPRKMKLLETKAVSTHTFVPSIPYEKKTLWSLILLFGSSFMNIVRYLLKNFLSREKKLDSIQELISKNWNVFLMIKLEHGGKQFVVGTYHMPWWIDHRKVAMKTIAIELLKNIRSFSYDNINEKILPFFLTGDFNSLPHDDVIRYLTIEAENYLNPAGRLNGSSNTEEKYFTCCSNISKTFDGKNTNDFRGQIDYILYDPNTIYVWNDGHIISDFPIVSLTHMPNESEPSDHLPVMESFKFKE